ncbi:MAG TPA: hypothetical protein VHC73_06105 [Vitreimonas sp.]|nr:hypothetical protein [Vitreimonas sp.]
MAVERPDLDCWIDAALGDDGWTGALDISAQVLGADSVALGLAAKPGVDGQLCFSAAASSGFRASCLELLGYYGAEEVQTRPTDAGLLAWAHAPSSAQRLVHDVAVFALWSGTGDPAKLPRVASVAARAVSARREIAEMRAVLALRGAAFDRLPFGVAVVDAALYVREPNAACRQILARADGLALHQDRLICRSGADQRALMELVSGVITGDREAAGGTVHVARSRGAEPYVVTPVSVADTAVNIDHCLLVILDPEANTPLTREAWNALMDLSSRGLALDAEGLSVARHVAERRAPFVRPRSLHRRSN